MRQKYGQTKHSFVYCITFVFMKCRLLLILPSALLFFSCSPSRKISRSARENVLNDTALQTAHVGISIYEPATGKYWFNYQGDNYFVPASNTKIPTCYAAMKYLGDSLVGLRYAIVRDSTLIVRGTGDPTFLHADFRTQSIFQFLKRFKFVSVEYQRFQKFFGNGWSWNDYKEEYMAQRSDFPIYGNVVAFKWLNKDSFLISPNFFRKRLNVYGGQFYNGFYIEKPWEQNNFSISSGTQKLEIIPFTPDLWTIADLLEDTLTIETFANGLPDLIYDFRKLYSQPTDSLLKLMMHRSDNFFAEQSLLMVSNEFLGVMNDAKIIDTLLRTDFKDLPQKSRWADGSGLSRYNLFSPQDFVFILNKMKTEFGMDRIKEIFPTGGEGTLSSYYQAESGYIYAKTGTLSGVVALSGFLYTKKNKLLIFSVLVNNHNASATQVRRAVEKFMSGIRNKY